MNQMIQLTVRTNAPETKITKQEGVEWWMDVHALPENNKANKEIIRFLSKHYKANVSIICGHKSKRKTVMILNTEKS